jgi:hypothetical protein
VATLFFSARILSCSNRTAGVVSDVCMSALSSGLYLAPPYTKPSSTSTSTTCLRLRRSMFFTLLAAIHFRFLRLRQAEGPFRSKTVAVLLRWNAKTFYEGTPKTVGIVKPNGIGDTFYGTAGGREAGPPFVKAKPLYKGSRTAFEFCLEPAENWREQRFIRRAKASTERS